MRGVASGAASGADEVRENSLEVEAATELASSRQVFGVVEGSSEAMRCREWLVGTIGESCDASLVAQAELTKSMEPEGLCPC